MEEFKINLLWSSFVKYAIRKRALIFWPAFFQNNTWISGSSVEKFPRSWVLNPKFRVLGPTSDMGLGSRSWVPPKVPGIGSHFSDMLTSNTFDISIRFFFNLKVKFQTIAITWRKSLENQAKSSFYQRRFCEEEVKRWEM